MHWKKMEPLCYVAKAVKVLLNFPKKRIPTPLKIVYHRKLV